MKTLFKAAALAVTILGTSVALPSVASAQQVAPATIIIVNMDRVVNQSAAGKYAASQLKTKADSLQARAKTLSDQFRGEEENLVKARQSNTMAQDAWQAKVKDLQQRKLNAENELRGRERDYGQSQQYVLQQISQAVNPIITQVMKERGAVIVLNEGATLQHAASIDVTNDVIARLDKALPRVNVNPPAQTSQAQPAQQQKK